MKQSLSLHRKSLSPAAQDDMKVPAPIWRTVSAKKDDMMGWLLPRLAAPGDGPAKGDGRKR
jgi:hypothetical protein